MKKITHLRFLTLAFIILALGSGCASAPERESDQPVATEISEAREIEPVVERSEWLSLVRENISQDLCGESEVFRTCYEVAESDCRVRARQAATSCGYQMWNSIPDALNGEQSEKLGGEIGSCAGDGMFQAFNAAFTYNETEQCQKVLSGL